MAERLTGDAALALLCNTLPTGAMLVVLIAVLSPISGAHLNPAVTAAFALKSRNRASRCGTLCHRADCRGDRRHRDCASDVRRPDPRSVRNRESQPQPVVFRGSSRIRAGVGDPRWHPLRAAFAAVAGRSLYYFRLLVHRLHILRQPGRHGRPLTDCEFLGHPTDRCSRLHRCAVCRGACRAGADELAPAAAEKEP